jgi:hypothetical protein
LPKTGGCLRNGLSLKSFAEFSVFKRNNSEQPRPATGRGPIVPAFTMVRRFPPAILLLAAFGMINNKEQEIIPALELKTPKECS